MACSRSTALSVIIALCWMVQSGATAGELHDAIGANNFAVVKKLIASGSDVKEPGALRFAIFKGNLEIAAALIDAGAGVNGPEFPLHVAARFGQAAIVALLIRRGSDVNALNPEGETPLFAAVVSGSGQDVEVMRILLAAGADPSIRDQKWGMNPLHMAAAHGQLAEAKLLLAAGLNVDLKEAGNDHYTALQDAIDRNHPSMVELLVKHGADFNLVNGHGLTPLAMAGANEEMKKMLIAAGAKK
jgi:uncharacterized protein